MHLALFILWALGIWLYSKHQEHQLEKRQKEYYKKKAGLPPWPYGKALENVEKQCLTGVTSGGKKKETIESMFPTLPPKNILALMMCLEIGDRGFKASMSDIEEYLGINAEYYDKWINSLSEEELHDIINYKYDFSKWPKERRH